MGLLGSWAIQVRAKMAWLLLKCMSIKRNNAKANLTAVSYHSSQEETFVVLSQIISAKNTTRKKKRQPHSAALVAFFAKSQIAIFFLWLKKVFFLPTKSNIYSFIVARWCLKVLPPPPRLSRSSKLPAGCRFRGSRSETKDILFPGCFFYSYKNTNYNKEIRGRCPCWVRVFARRDTCFFLSYK